MLILQKQLHGKGLSNMSFKPKQNPVEPDMLKIPAIEMTPEKAALFELRQRLSDLESVQIDGIECFLVDDVMYILESMENQY